jgi:histidine triad (HIT) family protein
MSEATCIFCKIEKGEIPAPKVLENEHAFVIADIHPQAKTHLLVIPRKHVRSLADGFLMNPEEMKMMSGELMSLGFEAAQKMGLYPDGFRTVMNTNEWGGQSVFHIHLHVLGGEPLSGGFA